VQGIPRVDTIILAGNKALGLFQRKTYPWGSSKLPIQKQEVRKDSADRNIKEVGKEVGQE
jgi:hypothetical protein